MPFLEIQQPGVPPIAVGLVGQDVHLGRADDNDVVLVADEVSRHHAKLCSRGGRYVMVDLNSLNGTFVNRQRVVERVLSHKDEVSFGSKCLLIFTDDSVDDGVAPPLPRTDTPVMQSLARVRQEMERAATNLTLMGQKSSVFMGSVTETPAPAPTPDELITMSRAYRRLDGLYRATKPLFSDFDLKKRISQVLDTVMEIMNADRGFLMLRDEETGRLTISVARGMEDETQSSSPSMGIAERAAQSGEPVIMTDADSDAEFGARQSIIMQSIHSAMCVPLQVEGRTLGSIYLDARRPGYSFDQEDLELFVSVATQSAMAIDNVQLYNRMIEGERKRANLGRFLSPAIVDQIINQSDKLELGGRRRVVSTLFCDIRNFTTLAEQISPDELVKFLNEHFTAMTALVFAHKGTLDKFIGDEVMAVFGAPISGEDDALRAARTAIAMQVKNRELNAMREREGRPTIHIGIGIDTGEVIAGYVGSPERMEFTVVGDHVNTARRLCGAAEPEQIVISEATFKIIADHIPAEPVGSLSLKGKATQVSAYQITATDQLA